jgi:hypothetical protein
MNNTQKLQEKQYFEMSRGAPGRRGAQFGNRRTVPFSNTK